MGEIDGTLKTTVDEKKQQARGVGRQQKRSSRHAKRSWQGITDQSLRACEGR